MINFYNINKIAQNQWTGWQQQSDKPYTSNKIQNNGEWRQIPGFSKYRANRDGRIQKRRSQVNAKFTGSQWKDILGTFAQQGTAGHLRMGLQDDNGRNRVWGASNLIARVFLPQQWTSGCMIKYKDNNPRNISVDNLLILGKSQMMRGHSGYNGLAGNAKLTPQQVAEIRDLYQDGFSYNQLARQFNVSPATIQHIIKQKTWKPMPQGIKGYSQNWINAPQPKTASNWYNRIK